MFSGSCTQQPDRPNNWEKRGDDQEDHGGHGHQDHGQLHQRHLLLQPWTCDHHQGSNTRHFQSWSRGDFRNKSEKIVHLLILRSLQSYGLLTRLIYRFFTIGITVSNVINDHTIIRWKYGGKYHYHSGNGPPVCDVSWPSSGCHDGNGQFQHQYHCHKHYLKTLSQKQHCYCSHMWWHSESIFLQVGLGSPHPPGGHSNYRPPGPGGPPAFPGSSGGPGQPSRPPAQQAPQVRISESNLWCIGSLV